MEIVLHCLMPLWMETHCFLFWTLNLQFHSSSMEGQSFSLLLTSKSNEDVWHYIISCVWTTALSYMSLWTLCQDSSFKKFPPWGKANECPLRTSKHALLPFWISIPEVYKFSALREFQNFPVLCSLFRLCPSRWGHMVGHSMPDTPVPLAAEVYCCPTWNNGFESKVGR